MADPSAVVAFGGGVLSFASPCVLPLVPGYLAMMSGVTVADLREPEAATRARVLRSSLLFVAGFTVVFLALGAGATAVGSALRHNRVVINQVSGVVIILFGLLLAGVLTPRSLMADRRIRISPSRLGALAPPVMGMAFAFGWTPCIGAILGPVLTLAGDQDTVGKGVLLLGAYSLGLGVPFVVTGMAFARLTGLFGWVKRHSTVINGVAGAMLVAFGLLLATNNVGELASRMQRVMPDFLSNI